MRRGYSLAQLNRLIPLKRDDYAYFINPVTAICHDLTFSKLPERWRRALCALLLPLTWLGYAFHHRHARGTETASAWQMPV